MTTEEVKKDPHPQAVMQAAERTNRQKLKKEKRQRSDAVRDGNEPKVHRWPSDGRNVLGSALFEKYYGHLVGQDELKILVDKLRIPLPVTFRFSESNQMSHTAYRQLVDEILPTLQNIEFEG